MASHHLTIAKASLTAALLRPAAVQVTRDSIAKLHNLLDAVVANCTISNIQKCKDWLLEFIIISPTRLSALGKYLISLSKHLPPDEPNPNGSTVTGLARATAISRRRLHILYLINDVLHHTKHHLHGQDDFTQVSASLEPFLEQLTALAVSDAKPKVRRRLEKLLQLWRAESYVSHDVSAGLEIALQGGVTLVDRAEGETNHAKDEKVNVSKNQKEPPFVMPPMHGDISTPWYDLPAGNLLPHIIPNSTLPIRPENIKPLQFTSGPPDASLVTALKEFLSDAERIDDGLYLSSKEATGGSQLIEINELGQVLWRDEAGDVVRGDSYYGWSREFCDKMKRRGKRYDSGRSRSRSRSGSYSPNSSRSRDRSNSGQRATYRMRRDGSRMRSRSASASRSPVRRYSSASYDDTERPSFFGTGAPAQAFISASNSTAQPPPPRPTFNMNFPGGGHAPIPSTGIPGFPNAPPPLPLGPSGIPLPPPRPAGYTGPWPPPPPPIMGFGPGGAGSPPPPFPGAPMGFNSMSGSFNQQGAAPPAPQGRGRGSWSGGR